MLTAEQRKIRARIAAHTLHSKCDSRKITESARANSPGNTDYFERQVDPDGKLGEVERRRRAEHAKKAHFSRMALKSAQARSRKSDS